MEKYQFDSTEEKKPDMVCRLLNCEYFDECDGSPEKCKLRKNLMEQQKEKNPTIQPGFVEEETKTKQEKKI